MESDHKKIMESDLKHPAKHQKYPPHKEIDRTTHVLACLFQKYLKKIIIF